MVPKTAAGWRREIKKCLATLPETARLQTVGLYALMRDEIVDKFEAAESAAECQAALKLPPKRPAELAGREAASVAACLGRLKDARFERQDGSMSEPLIRELEDGWYDLPHIRRMCEIRLRDRGYKGNPTAKAVRSEFRPKSDRKSDQNGSEIQSETPLPSPGPALSLSPASPSPNPTPHPTPHPGSSAGEAAGLFGGGGVEQKPQRKRAKPDPTAIPASLDTPEFRAVWPEWEQYRREIGETLTPTTVRRQLAKLDRFGPAAAVASIVQSIENGWTGLFEPRNDRKPANGHHHPQHKPASQPAAPRRVGEFPQRIGIPRLGPKAGHG